MTHEAGHRPLVAFTSLAIAGAGLIVAAACLEQVHHRPFPPALVAGALLQAAGLAVSLGHLGQKRRAGLAARGAGRSALSNEALLAGLAIASASVVAGLDLWGAHGRGVTAIAGVINAVFLVSIGLVYRVRGQQTWQGFSAITPLTGGCAFGVIAIQSLFLSGGVSTLTFLVVAIDALLFTQRWRDAIALSLPSSLLVNPWLTRRSQVLATRFFLLDVVPAVLMVASPTPLAAAVAAAGLLVDRIGFYALAVQHTTEHEVAAVEDLIANSSR